MVSASFTLLVSLAASASSLAIENRQAAACSKYTIISTRGTGELQGPSSGFRTMNSNIQRQVPGGSVYNTMYLAGADQNSAAGTADIVRKIQSLVAANPNECIVLQGYSQGAAATVNAMPRITGASFDAVKAVFMIGDPNHKAGLACNVDNRGGATTRNVNGLSAALSSGIPSNWVAKTLDVCIFGDGVCDTMHGFGINAQHLMYGSDSSTQNMGTTFVVGKLQGK